jgi:hypothetical protein
VAILPEQLVVHEQMRDLDGKRLPFSPTPPSATMTVPYTLTKGGLVSKARIDERVSLGGAEESRSALRHAAERRRLLRANGFAGY